MQLIQNSLGRDSHVLFCFLVGESRAHICSCLNSRALGEREGGRKPLGSSFRFSSWILRLLETPLDSSLCILLNKPWRPGPCSRQKILLKAGCKMGLQPASCIVGSPRATRAVGAPGAQQMDLHGCLFTHPTRPSTSAPFMRPPPPPCIPSA